MGDGIQQHRQERNHKNRLPRHHYSTADYADYDYDNFIMHGINFGNYPPFFVASGIIVVDKVCYYILGGGSWCSSWRSLLLPEWMYRPNTSWFSNQFQRNLKSEFEYMPPTLSYHEYYLQKQQQQQHITTATATTSTSTDSSTTITTTQEPTHYYSIELMKEYAFDTNSTDLGTINTGTACLALLVLVMIMKVLKRLIIPQCSQIARRVQRQMHGVSWEKIPSNQIRITKFGEYVFRLVFHSLISMVGIYLFFDKPWWSSVSSYILYPSNTKSLGTKTLYINYPFQPIEPGMAWYYLIQAAYNVEAMMILLEISIQISFRNPIFIPKEAGIITTSTAVCHSNSNNNNNNNEDDDGNGNGNYKKNNHTIDDDTEERQENGNNTGKPQGGITTKSRSCYRYRLRLPIMWDWSESCRGDFREMFVHHIFTNLLIFLSSIFRFTYVGSMVLLIHDISDIPVDLSKLANFLKWKKTTISCFIIMCVTWIVTRLIILPGVVLRSIFYESRLVCATTTRTMNNGGEDDGGDGEEVDRHVPPFFYNIYQPIFIFLLGFLVLLHFFWFTMFIQMGYTLVSKGETHDLSEHKKGEQQQTQTTASTARLSTGSKKTKKTSTDAKSTRSGKSGNTRSNSNNKVGIEDSNSNSNGGGNSAADDVPNTPTHSNEKKNK